MRKVLLSSVVFLSTPLMIAFCLIYLSFISYKQNPTLSYVTKIPNVAYAALPQNQNSLEGQILNQQDARVELVRNFFQRYNSPLTPFAQNVVDNADKYSLDYRLIPAIAMQESNLCKKAPADSYNCWGFGIYGKQVTKFSDYTTAIETVSKTLSQNYKDQGLETPEQIMSRYTPGSNGSWANGVNQFMDQLQLTL